MPQCDRSAPLNVVCIWLSWEHWTLKQFYKLMLKSESSWNCPSFKVFYTEDSWCLQGKIYWNCPSFKVFYTEDSWCLQGKIYLRTVGRRSIEWQSYQNRGSVTACLNGNRRLICCDRHLKYSFFLSQRNFRIFFNE